MTHALSWTPATGVEPLAAPAAAERWPHGWSQLLRTISRQSGSDKQFEQICRDVVTGFGFSRSIIATVDEKNHRLVARAGYDPNLRTQAYMALVRLFQIPLAPRPDGRLLIAAWCVQRQEQVYVPDASRESFRPDEVTQRPFVIKALGTTEFVLTPIVYRGRTVAVLGVDKKGSHERITADERRLLLDITALLALALGPSWEAQEMQVRGRSRSEGSSSWTGMLRSAESLRPLLERLDEALLLVDAGQRIRFANAAAATLLGSDIGEITGRSLRDVLRVAQPDALESLLESGRAGGHSLRKRQRLIAPSGNDYEADVRVFSLGPAPHGYAIVLVPGGERVHRRRFQDEVFRSALHDLLAPIQSIVGFAELLHAGRAGPLTSEQEEFVARISGGGEELIGFIERLMTVQLLESRDQQPTIGTIAPAPLIDAVFARVEGKALRAGVRLVHDVNGQLPALAGDESRLKAVFQNVLDNAIDAAEPGATVRLTGAVHHDERYARFSVTGEPVPAGSANVPDMLTFDDDWTRTGAGRKRRSHGLGLTIIRRVVEGYGGEVWAHDEDEGELSITFTLPLAHRELGVKENHI